MLGRVLSRRVGLTIRTTGSSVPGAEAASWTSRSARITSPATFWSSSVRSVAAAAAVNPNRELKVRHILVKHGQSSKLKELSNQLEDGGSFASLAANHSTCPSGSKGGDLGWVKKGMMVPEFEQCVFGTDVGTTATCTTQFGHHLVLVEEEREAPPEVKSMGPLELKELLEVADTEDIQLLDVREAHELDIVSLPGFKHYPLSGSHEWGSTIVEDLDPSKKTLCLCHHGGRSRQMAQFLLGQGFTDVINIAGGIDAYAQLADTTLARY